MYKHNKKKNARIVYEQLMVLATRLSLTNHHKESKYILSIVKEHFHPSTQLGKEKKLFDAILQTKTSSPSDAEAILAEVLTEARCLDEKRLEKEKIDLINRVMNEVGKDLFSIPLKDFKLTASAQILFNEMRNNFKFSSPTERVKIKTLILENMKKEEKEEFSYDMDNFTFNILVEKFNKKYSGVMNEDQKEILKSWIDYLLTEDSKKFKNTINKKLSKVKAELDIQLLTENHHSGDYTEMLQEARNKIGKNVNLLNEDTVYEVMRYFDLVEDLKEAKNERA